MEADPMGSRAQVPVEWASQEAVWMTWPTQERWWPGRRKEALEAFSTLAGAISQRECLRINCPKKYVGEVEAILSKAKCDLENVEFFPNETDDVWCRDSGGVFRINAGKLEVVDFRYNAWGGKFSPWNKDDALARHMAACADARDVRIDAIVCEGGALEMGEDGTLMTTESVLLNPNRNPGIPRGRIEEILLGAYGADRILWLKEGLFNDDTDGHIDNIARFAPNNTIVAAICGKANPSCGSLTANLQALRDARNKDGKPFNVVELPLPENVIISDGGDALPASYANWLVINGAVLMPTFGQPKSDEAAAEILKTLFKGRDIVGIDSRTFLFEGGAVHCLTQQQPELRKS